MSPFFGLRRKSRPSSIQNNDHPGSPPTSYIHSNTPPLSNAVVMPNGTAAGGPAQAHQGSRPPSSVATSSSFDFANRPVSQTIPVNSVGSLSRTDQIVLRHFWDNKYEENKSRDLHFLKFPSFPQNPSHKDLIPYCEIYHLVKTSPGAKIMSLGSTNGVYIGFELFSGSQLHIDMDDEWHDITHHRVTFKPYESMLRDPTSEATFKSWPKPLTIEFLEDQFLNRWVLDLTSLCWEANEVSELGSHSGAVKREQQPSKEDDMI